MSQRHRPIRPLALHESALSPSEYEHYAALVDAFQADSTASVFAEASDRDGQQVQRLWEYLLRWIAPVDKRTEKEILSFFAAPISSPDNSSPIASPPLQILLALTRLYAHSLETRHLTRDLVFLAADPAPFVKVPRPQTSNAALSRAKTISGNPFYQLGVGGGPSRDSAATAPSGELTSSSNLQRATSNPFPRHSVREPPPMPPPKRISSAQPAFVPANPASKPNPFRPPLTSLSSSSTTIKVVPSDTFPASPPPSVISSSSAPVSSSSSTVRVRAHAGSPPGLPPRHRSSDNKGKQTTAPLVPARRLGKSADEDPTRVTLASSSKLPSKLGASLSSSTKPAPAPPPRTSSKLASSSHIGIGGSVRLSTGASTLSSTPSGSSADARSSPTRSKKNRPSRSNSHLSSASSTGSTSGQYSYERAGGTVDLASPPSSSKSGLAPVETLASTSSTSSSKFKHFVSGSVSPPLPVSPPPPRPKDSSLARSKSLTSNSSGSTLPPPPPPPKRNPSLRKPAAAQADPFEERSTSQHQRSASLAAMSDSAAQVSSMLKQHGEEWLDRAKGSLDVDGKARQRRGSAREERERLVARAEDDEDEEVDADEVEDLVEDEKMKELEREVRRQSERGQWVGLPA